MAGIRTENQIYEVGVYCRLSKDDGTENESASIATQKSILTDYVKKQGWHLAKTYVDDGYSGTNFQRPSFQNMIKDIENGLINCVITKDLSRLGRNYLDCGLYLEVFFPENNVRYIAVNDGVDTLNKSAMDITPFRNILNEMYAADISVKIKSAYRARFQQGKFMGTYAPYGYIKDPADHNHLLIDDKVAHVVREIFDLALAGNGIEKIRKHLNKQHILCPAAYSVSQGETGYERHFEGDEDRRYFWSNNSVRNILRSPVYAGNLVGYRRVAVSMKSKKKLYKLPEEWEVVPDTHEGIVTQAEFDTVQQLMTSRRREQNAGGFKNIFAGVVKCADCGYAMRAMNANRRKRPDIIDCVQYNCNNYGKYGNTMCTAHSMEARDLFNAVLADINRFADMAVNDEKAVRAIEKRLTETDQSKARAMEKEQKKLNKRLAELDRLFSSLYEDKVMERITERNFEMMSGKYQKEQLEIETRLKEVMETLNESYEKSQGIRDFLSLIRNYQGLKELDATIVNALIDKIFVSEREKMADGTVKQKIKICYKFIGFVDELHITPTKRWSTLPPQNCTVCGVEYVPGSGVSKYCPVCARKVRLERSNESRRRSREQKMTVCIELSAKNDRLDWTYWLILWVIQALTQGFATRISHHFGEKNIAKLRKSITMSVFLCVGIGILLTVLALLLVIPMLHVLKTPTDIFDGASSYLFTMFAGTLIVMAYNMASAILRAFGDGKTPLIAMGIAASANIVLDLLFVLVFGLGIVGAAIATLIAQLISFLYCLTIIRKIDFIKTQRNDWQWDSRIVYELCAMGLPLALQHVLIAIGGMILQSTINSQGFVFVAGFTATNKIYGLLESSAFALNYATTTYISQNYGARLYDRIHKGMKSATLIGVIMSFCIATLMIVFGRNILQLFIDSSDSNATDVLAIAYRYLATMSTLLFSLYLLHIYRSALQGLGNAFCPMFSGIIEFVMRVVAALIFTNIWGSAVIFFAEILAWVGAAVFVIAAYLVKAKNIPRSQDTKGFSTKTIYVECNR